MAVTLGRRDYESVRHAADVYTPQEIANFKEACLWTDRLLVDYLEEHARTRPTDDAVVDEHRRVSWHDLNASVNRIAAGYLDRGLRPGDFIALQIPNRIEFVEAYLAAQKAGLKALTLLSIYRDKDVAYMLQKCAAKAYIVPDSVRGFDHVAMAGRMMDSVESLTDVVIIGDPGEGMLSYSRLPRDVDPGDEALRQFRPDPDSLSKVSFTSGTTGLPKGVAHTHNTDMVPPMLIARALGLDSSTPIWMPSPIAHATGILFGVYDALICGAKLVLQDLWDPGAALEMISRERAVFTVSATPFIAAMVDHPDVGKYDISSFRYFVSGGARVAPSLVERVRDEMDCMLLRVFGQSEAPLHTLNFPTDPWEKIVSRDGRAFEGIVVRIADPENRKAEVARGDLGEYSTWGPHVFLGYFDEPERTREAKDEDGWYYSGDLCTMDDEGYVLYVDRVKDIINRGGLKISALEVENLLIAHPSVQGVAVVAIPDQRLGERACAFVVPRGDAVVSLEELAAFLDSKGVTKQKWPERLEIVRTLPTTPTGKIQKNILRDELAALDAAAAST